MVEEPVEVQSFRKQITQGGLYKLWPMQPMTRGEDAVVEYTQGKANIQVWDFAIKPGGNSENFIAAARKAKIEPVNRLARRR